MNASPKKKPKSKKVAQKKISAKSVDKKTVENKMGIKKVYLKSKKICKVTFRLPEPAAADADRVAIVGDFNNWDENAHLMKKLKNGSHTLTIDLEPGREYQYRYLIDGIRWENDWYADKYVLSPYRDSDNSVVIV